MSKAYDFLERYRYTEGLQPRKKITETTADVFGLSVGGAKVREVPRTAIYNIKWSDLGGTGFSHSLQHRG